jgi:hypothetical protein
MKTPWHCQRCGQWLGQPAALCRECARRERPAGWLTRLTRWLIAYHTA